MWRLYTFLSKQVNCYLNGIIILFLKQYTSSVPITTKSTMRKHVVRLLLPSQWWMPLPRFLRACSRGTSWTSATTISAWVWKHLVSEANTALSRWMFVSCQTLRARSSNMCSKRQSPRWVTSLLNTLQSISVCRWTHFILFKIYIL